MPPSDFVFENSVTIKTKSLRSGVTGLAAESLTTGEFIYSYINFQGTSAGQFYSSRDLVGAGGSAAASTPGWEFDPQIVATADGGYVVAYTAIRIEASSGAQTPGDIYIAKYGGTIEWGPSLIVSPGDVQPVHQPGTAQSYGTGESQPAIAELPSGYIAIAFVAEGGIFAQLRTADGAVIVQKAAVSAPVQGNSSSPIISPLADGSFLIIWQSNGGNADASDFDLLGQKMSAAGAKIGSEFKVNSVTLGSQDSAASTVLEGGTTVVVWESGDDIRGQRFDANGNKIGGDFLVTSSGAGIQSNPDVESYHDGGFIVTWKEGLTIFGRTFSAEGAPVSGDIDFVTTSTSASYDMEVTNGSVVILFSDGQELYRSVFAPPSSGNFIGTEQDE